VRAMLGACRTNLHISDDPKVEGHQHRVTIAPFQMNRELGAKPRAIKPLGTKFIRSMPVRYRRAAARGRCSRRGAIHGSA